MDRPAIPAVLRRGLLPLYSSLPLVDDDGRGSADEDGRSGLTGIRCSVAAAPPPTRDRGRERAAVRIGENCTEPVPKKSRTRTVPCGDIDAAEARLAYVAITRARHRLDIGGLS